MLHVPGLSIAAQMPLKHLIYFFRKESGHRRRFLRGNSYGRGGQPGQVPGRTLALWTLAQCEGTRGPGDGRRTVMSPRVMAPAAVGDPGDPGALAQEQA